MATPRECSWTRERSTRYDVLVKSKENKEKIINSSNKSEPIEKNHQPFQKPRVWMSFKCFCLHSDADQSLTLSGIFLTVFLLGFKSPQATAHRGSILVNTELIVNIVTM